VIPELTFAELAAVFGEQGVLRTDPALLPEGLRHDETRGFLSAVGFPSSDVQGLVVVDEQFPRAVRGMREASHFTEYGWELPPEAADLFLLGEFQGAAMGVIGIDGASGAVRMVSELDMSRAVLLNSDISRLTYFLYVLRRDEHLYSWEHYDEHEQPDPESPEPDTMGQAAERIRQEFQRADPAALEEGENVWDAVLEDIARGEWT